MVFEIWIDGRRIMESGILRFGDFYHFDVPIPAGSKIFRLVVSDAGNGTFADHGDWVEAGFLRREFSHSG